MQPCLYPVLPPGWLLAIWIGLVALFVFWSALELRREESTKVGRVATVIPALVVSSSVFVLVDLIHQQVFGSEARLDPAECANSGTRAATILVYLFLYLNPILLAVAAALGWTSTSRLARWALLTALPIWLLGVGVFSSQFE